MIRVNPAIEHLPRQQRRHILERETSRRKSGNWGPWEIIPLPNGAPGGGWCRDVESAHRNAVFCVLSRPIHDGHYHLAISSLSGVRPTFHEMQRIKNEILGYEATAVEVYPPQSDLVDDADMFHLWSTDPLTYGLQKR
jgi:hypothetical protein